MKRNLLRYGIPALVGGVIAWAFVALRNYGAGFTTSTEWYLMLCDAFTVPGVLLFLFGVLIWISNEGTFDGISYGVKHLFRSLVPFGRTGEAQEKYYDYVQRRREKGKAGFGALMLVGLGYFLVGMVFLILFYNA